MKQYSADLFFAAAWFWVFHSEALDERRRLLQLSLLTLVAPFFSFTAWFVLGALTLTSLLDRKERKCWAGHPWILVTQCLCVLVALAGSI